MYQRLLHGCSTWLYTTTEHSRSFIKQYMTILKYYVVFIPDVTTNHAISHSNDMKKRNNTIKKHLTGLTLTGQHLSKH